MEGFDKWCEIFSFILSNRSVGDVKVINLFGILFFGYGRVEVVYICFMFVCYNIIFGGFDDLNFYFVLVGFDYKRQVEQFVKEIEFFLLSEVYEYG